ncbi:hypothetical protein CIL03_13090 [Virgibacillus indicus]|uniref:VanZ-like domain-containing protein n=1 Tax=Virgibacillus indicus TaxID=2024554 RepID=A0A265N7U7_9BACI|nr:VanZ family protein [Virgibacillus indicus]OZU88063.1 hypothetical protein CIL03_13090 [Virgibacillus indicus]
MFIGTCTEDVHALLNNGDISFVFTLSPAWGNMFIVYPIGSISTFEFAGHFTMFFVLTYLLKAIFINNGYIIAAVVTIAMATEIMQVFFGRGAELYDLLADVSGAIVVLGTAYWIGVFRKVASNQR